MKTIIYFTLTGNNKRIAEKLKKKGDKLIEFSPGNNLRIFQIIFKSGIKREAKKLKIKGDVILCGPIWMARPCPAITALIENLSLKNCNVSVHLTHMNKPMNAKKITIELLKKHGAKIKEIKLKKI